MNAIEPINDNNQSFVLCLKNIVGLCISKLDFNLVNLKKIIFIEYVFKYLFEGL